MANVVCSECGATAISKCPYCRSVFETNQNEAMIAFSLKTAVEERHGKKFLMVGVQLADEALVNHEDGTSAWEPKEETPAEAFERLVDLCKSAMTHVGARQWVCHHKWVFAPGQHSTIGCGH